MADTIAFLIFDSEAEHRDAVARIDAAFRTRALARGHRLKPDGSVMARNAATGEDAPDAQGWVTWEYPAPRATDGKFPCRHPSRMTVAADVDARTGRTALQDAMAGLDQARVETVTRATLAEWWPDGRDAAARTLRDDIDGSA